MARSLDNTANFGLFGMVFLGCGMAACGSLSQQGQQGQSSPPQVPSPPVATVQSSTLKPGLYRAVDAAIELVPSNDSSQKGTYKSRTINLDLYFCKNGQVLNLEPKDDGDKLCSESKTTYQIIGSELIIKDRHNVEMRTLKIENERLKANGKVYYFIRS